MNELLDRLYDAKCQADVLRINHDEQQAKILAVVQDQLDALEAEYLPMANTISTRIAELEAEAKAQAIKSGESIKGAYLMAVYAKPRVTWDSTKLDGYAAAHPEINAFRKVGEPSVSFRAVKS